MELTIETIRRELDRQLERHCKHPHFSAKLNQSPPAVFS